MPSERKKEKDDSELVLDPSVVRKKLSKALSREDTSDDEFDFDDLDFSDLLEDDGSSEESKTEEEVREVKTEESTSGDILDELDFDFEDEKNEFYEKSLDDLFEEPESKSVVEKVESEESKRDVEQPAETEDEKKVVIDIEEESEEESHDEEEDSVDYTFEGYEEPEEPEILAEFGEDEAKALLREYEQFEEWLKSLEGAIPASAILVSGRDGMSQEHKEAIEKEFEGIYICHESHLKPIHPPIDNELAYGVVKEYVPDIMNMYEVAGLRGFWLFTGVKGTDLESVLMHAAMLRHVPPNDRFPNAFKFGELVVVMRDDGFHILARMNINPFVFINVGRKYI